ncbi:hypothetical protein CPARA_2gp220 (nucleomorph) [Cryptomonas paramecium]|uniref:Uncharacterized protein n=1 Tax=Cryptomonas paramaecium TaxID=2898 RepID=F2HHT2_9CRYP|nr:hypothetical protein CPARA_2gp220 [Cryptomonas paramecium]AEA38878.1 hypothetical protein CPARA_2gp220 [Cryptomonas paramecium]|mmetsp:Transcript_88800/g.236400  ORF Transcript_88800/g.236400 Transcript_88800/m.236400 type:complete len:107 (+) Transcript_88800:4479-4799(+)
MIKKDINKLTYIRTFGPYSKQPKFYIPSYIVQFFKTKPIKNYKKFTIKRKSFPMVNLIWSYFPKMILNRNLLSKKDKLFSFVLNFDTKLIGEIKINYKFFIQSQFV